MSTRSCSRARRPSHDAASAFSAPSPSAGTMSVPRSTARICRIVSASGMLEEGEGKIRHELRNIRRQDVGQELPDVVVDSPPSSTAATMLAKLSSRSTISAACRATSVPVNAHRDADIGGAQRWRVVDAVTRGRHDRAMPLQRRHDAQLLVGSDPREEHIRSLQCRPHLRVGHASHAGRR